MKSMGVTLDGLARSSDMFPQVRKDDLFPGDWVIIRTVRSEYRLKVLNQGLFEVRGGWFDRKGHSPIVIGVAGATWGGSAIMPQVVAACGMRIEFRNHLITSPVENIIIFRNSSVN